MNNIVRNKPVPFFACFITALVFSLLIQGAIPFLTAPALGQAVWTIGFSQSFVNDSIFSIYAKNFGAPEPAAIAFGLSGAWPASIFIRLGASAIDAYTMMATLWLTIAFCSAYKIGRYLNVSCFGALLGALTWMTMPVIWAHSDYSMLSLGIGLLPFYFLAALHLFSNERSNKWTKLSMAAKSVFYFFACMVSVFMDGYSFMMFAVGSTILLAANVYEANKGEKTFLFKFSLPVHFVSLFSVYLLYSSFMGTTQFSPAPIDFFRGWGVDVIFMLSPANGVHWIMDLIGISASRSGNDFWGDSSVWRTSFCLPIILVGIFSLWKTELKGKKLFGFIFIAMFGIYMALGPSLKFNSKKSVGHAEKRMMPAEYAVTPTGSSVLSENLPGFTSMRASYRWLALGVFAAWTLSLLLLISPKGKYKISGGMLLFFVVLLNLPNIPQKLKESIGNRSSFFALEHDIVDDMAAFVSQGDRLAFLPWRNDFLVNYTASKLKVVAFNIGGDKNYAMARQHWPSTMRQFQMATVDKGFSNRILLLLAEREADTVILPYIDMLLAAHDWPSPTSFSESMASVVQTLNESGVVAIIERKYFAVVKLTSEWENSTSSEILKELCMVPFCLDENGFSPPVISRVGVINGQWLESTGSKGMLHFGPYLPMRQGAYHLIVYGTAKTTGHAWVDVASDLGRKIHGRFNLIEKNETSDQILADAEVALEHDVRDLEVRVYVESEDKVSLRGYSLKLK